MCACTSIDVFGKWSTEGCSLTSIDDDEVTCECNHLTHFGLLLVRFGSKKDRSCNSKLPHVKHGQKNLFCINIGSDNEYVSTLVAH